MDMPQRNPDERVKHLLRVYRDPADGDGLHGARGVLAVCGFVLFAVGVLVSVYAVFELMR